MLWLLLPALAHLLEQADGGGLGDVQRFGRALHGDFHASARQRDEFGRHAAAFVAENPSTGRTQIQLVEQGGAVAVQCGGVYGVRILGAPFGQADALLDVEQEVRAHAGTQDFGGIGIGAAFAQDDLADAGRRRAAQHGANIACVLHAVEQHIIGRFGRGGRRQRNQRHQVFGLVQLGDFAQCFAADGLDDIRRQPAQECGNFGFMQAVFRKVHLQRRVARVQIGREQMRAFQDSLAVFAAVLGVAEQFGKVFELGVLGRLDGGGSHGAGCFWGEWVCFGDKRVGNVWISVSRQ